VDVGGGDGTNAIAIAEAYPEVHIALIDLPGNCQLAENRAATAGLSKRVVVKQCNMFTDPFPTGYDCFLFVHQLVIWPLTVVTSLLQRSYDALSEGGKVVIFNSMSRDEEDGPLMSALDSAYFVSIPSEGGMIYTWRDYEECLNRAGFQDVQRIPCSGWTPHGIIVATR